MAAQDAARNIRALDMLATQDSWIHRLHPLGKLLTTVAYVGIVASFGRYETTALLPLLAYPLLMALLGDVPLGLLCRRVLAVMPFLILVGALNPVLDRQPVWVMGTTVAQGWLTFASIVFKGVLTVSAALTLIATTGMQGVAFALRQLHVPRILVLQLQLTYRYIALLLDEVHRVLLAYRLRSHQKGVAFAEWGTLAGSVLLRAYARADRVYTAMRLRGFEGEYRMGMRRWQGMDTIWLLTCLAVCGVVRWVNVPVLLGWLLGM